MVRSILILCILPTCVFGTRIIKQKIAIRKLSSLGSKFIYENQRTRIQGLGIPENRPPGPELLAQLLGPDFFDTVGQVYGGRKFTKDHIKILAQLYNIKAFSAWNAPVDDEFVRSLSTLKTIEYLDLSSTAVSDECAASLARLPIRFLNLSFTKIGDKAIEKICNIETLESLIIGETKISDKSLRLIATKSKKLKTLFIQRTNVSYAGLLHLADLMKLKYVLVELDMTDRQKTHLSKRFANCEVENLHRD